MERNTKITGDCAWFPAIGRLIEKDALQHFLINTSIEIYTYQLSNPNGLLWEKTRQNNPVFNEGEQGERGGTTQAEQSSRASVRVTLYYSSFVEHLPVLTENARI